MPVLVPVLVLVLVPSTGQVCAGAGPGTEHLSLCVFFCADCAMTLLQRLSADVQLRGGIVGQRLVMGAEYLTARAWSTRNSGCWAMMPQVRSRRGCRCRPCTLVSVVCA